MGIAHPNQRSRPYLSPWRISLAHEVAPNFRSSKSTRGRSSEKIGLTADALTVTRLLSFLEVRLSGLCGTSTRKPMYWRRNDSLGTVKTIRLHWQEGTQSNSNHPHFSLTSGLAPGAERQFAHLPKTAQFENARSQSTCSLVQDLYCYSLPCTLMTTSLI